MNKKIIITQRPDLISERVVSNHITRLPLSRQKQIAKPVEAWHMHQSGVFSTRNRVEVENKSLFEHQRVQSTVSDRPQKHSEVDLANIVGLVSELAKLNTQTQERLTELTSRVSRLEHSFSEFKSTCPQTLTQQIEKSLDQLYSVINTDFKNSQESIIRHVGEIRDEVRSVTNGKLEELQRQVQRELRAKVEEIRRDIGGSVDRIREDVRREVERVKGEMDGWRGRVQREIGRVGVDDCTVNRARRSMATLVKFMCSAKTDKLLYPINIHEYCYYVTTDGYLTDQNGYLITDSQGENISLSPQHLRRLRQAGLLLQ